MNAYPGDTTPDGQWRLIAHPKRYLAAVWSLKNNKLTLVGSYSNSGKQAVGKELKETERRTHGYPGSYYVSVANPASGSSDVALIYV